ncbi:IclR family transcriptional regulator [Pigmentiphaga kullae]|uniref:IclR family transcriptional regulator n=1 Tax=Pigmentiphaga kullae TaxID=151784 RepID=A0A4Q7N7X3_9BURK|nr:IclR family transcriptional regulator [Pigmentiphaga kullae]RZS78054.1 IclR family transcriptional regulator [Pigmentiphaga kullae]
MDKTAAKTLRAFEHMCRIEKSIGVSALAAKLDITKSNAHRILTTLVETGYVQQLESGEYFPTLKIWELGSMLLSRLDFVQIAKPHLRRLSEATGEQVYLASMSSGAVVYLDVIASKHPIRTYASIGSAAPLHCSASGKVLLAYNQTLADEYLAAPLEKYTPRTVTKEADLRKVLDEVRKKGYATNDGEWHEGVCGASAPVHTAFREGVAAIGISALKERTPRTKLVRFGEELRQVSVRISRELGYHPALQVLG